MLLFVRARVVFLLLAGVFGSMAGMHAARADGSSPSTSAASSAETGEERFRRLEAEGDRALADEIESHFAKKIDSFVQDRPNAMASGVRATKKRRPAA